MRVRPALVAATACIIVSASGFAQNPRAPLAPALESAPLRSPKQEPTCPSGGDTRTGSSAETTGSGANLSRQLSESGGVLCPPADGDTDMVERPSTDGSLRIIPPPGSPGGDQTVTPK